MGHWWEEKEEEKEKKEVKIIIEKNRFIFTSLNLCINFCLNESSKILISFLMIVGRFGPMLLALMFVGRRSMSKAKPAYEIVRIG